MILTQLSRYMPTKTAYFVLIAVITQMTDQMIPDPLPLSSSPETPYKNITTTPDLVNQGEFT
jgi:hypothetical protein